MVVGLVGGVGSGKSAINDILEKEYHFIILKTDDIAKEIELPGQAGYEALTAEFGEKILCGGVGSEIDKTAFAALIYSDPAALEKVNALIHPLVWSYVEERILAERAKDPAIRIAVETALPCERFSNMCTEIWFIYTDREVRIGRLMASRGYSREKCISIIDNQLSDEEFSAYADYMVDNSADLAETRARIGELL